jgi:hypothetical protein
MDLMPQRLSQCAITQRMVEELIMRQKYARGSSCRLKLLVSCAALVVLLACQPNGPDNAFANYLHALSKALSIVTPDVRPEAVPPLSEVGEWQLVVPASGIDNLDILQVSGCDVQANIGKRQTGLGQSAKPSQRLLLELEYLRLAPSCINQLRESRKASLAGTLQQAWHEKQAQLPALIFNATLGSAEYHAFWLATPAPGDYPRSSPELTISALEAINALVHRWLSGDYRAANRDFELSLSEIAGGDGGVQLQSRARQAHWIATADAMVEQRLSQEHVCPKPKDLTSLTARLRSEFTNTIQPLTAQSQHRYQLITAPISALEIQLRSTIPIRYRNWMHNRKKTSAALGSAAVRHLNLLNQLPQVCSNSRANHAH